MKEGLSINKPLPFSKMQACGNDFIVISELDWQATISSLDRTEASSLLPSLTPHLCDRHFGIGADGIIIARQQDSKTKQFAWTYLNSDGSYAAVCGNGLRCLALWLQKKLWTSENQISVLTDKGPIELCFLANNLIESNLGTPVLEPDKIPFCAKDKSQCINQRFDTSIGEAIFTAVGMGNPHCVIFEPTMDSSKYACVASEIQSASMFPQGVNVEFVQIISPNQCHVKVWERGAGYTLACASGAAAVIVAGVLTGYLATSVDVYLPGGILQVSWSDKDSCIRIAGPASFVFEGSIDLKNGLDKVIYDGH